MKDVEILHSRRLLLKDFEDSDRDFSFVENKNYSFFSDLDFEDFLEKSEKDSEVYPREVAKFGENQSLGAIFARLSQDEEKIGEIRLIISDSYKNRGYGTEAVNLVSDYLFTDLGVEKIYLKIQRENLPMIEVAKKANFKKVGEEEKLLTFELTNILFMFFQALEA